MPRPLLPLLALVVMRTVTVSSAWAQENCIDFGPPGCQCDCSFDDICPQALPGFVECVAPQDIPDPPSPHCGTDRFFVKEETAYACGGWGNPIDKTIHVTRYVGPIMDSEACCANPPDPEAPPCDPCGPLINASDYVAKGRLGATATLSIMAWDVDRVGSECFPEVEKDEVSFNGIPVAGLDPSNLLGRLRGSNQRWARTDFEIPVEIINFPKDPGLGGSIDDGAPNLITIAVPDSCRCVAIGWVSLRIKAASPIALVPGARTNAGFWGVASVTIDDHLRQERFVVIDDISHQNDSIALASSNLHDELVKRGKQYGVDSMHLVAHSKGGLDSLRFLVKEHPSTDSFNILSVTTIDSPLRGSVLADMVQARQQALIAAFFGFPLWTNVIQNFIGAIVPGTAPLTTWSVAGLMGHLVPLLPTKDITYQTVSADLDINNNEHASCTPDEFYEIRQFVPIVQVLPCIASQWIADNLYRSLRLKRTVRYQSFLGIGVVVTAVDETTAQGNDILVTIKSARGPQGYRDLVATEIEYNYPTGGKNHASVADAETAALIIPLIAQTEATHGDFHPTRVGACFP